MPPLYHHYYYGTMMLISVIPGLPMVILAASLAGCQQSSPDSQTQTVWPMQVGGSWYPDDPAVLRRQLDRYLAAARQGLPASARRGQLLGLIAPHAGYRFSGATAAYGYELLRGSGVKRAIVLGPAHRHPLRGLAVVAADAIAIPGKILVIDRDMVQHITRHCLIRVASEAYAGEHSIEMQLPFIKRLLPDVVVVPLLVGHITPAEARDIGQWLAHYCASRDTVIIASSDFTHFGPNYGYVPFSESVAQQLKTLDMGAWEHIARRDIDGLVQYKRSTGATICGFNPIAILLAAMPASANAHLLSYTTSGAILGDYTNSVSYLAAAFTIAGQNQKQQVK